MQLVLQNVGKQFSHSSRETLADINLEIHKGEFICFVGPSGCGKSTLLKLVAGLEKPSTGKILLDENEIASPGADRVMMFQESALYPWKTVLENVMFGMELSGIPVKERTERAKHYLHMVRLQEFMDYPIHHLSGGMKQRTALARALSLDGQVLLMDEPFSALDKQTINILRKELEDIWIQTGKTILYVTHSVEEAVFFADRVVVLSEHPGKIKRIYSINLERPRRIDKPDFLEIRKKILDEVQNEVAKIAGDEYDKN